MARPSEIEEVQRWAAGAFGAARPQSPAGEAGIRVLGQDHNTLHYGMSCLGTRITIGSRGFEHGLGTHANSDRGPPHREQLWITNGGEPAKEGAEQQSRVEAEAKRLRPIAEEAARMGCTVALYNHGGWFGEPENQIAIIDRLKADGVTNVGIVYNQHHGHDHLDRFRTLLREDRISSR